MHLTHPSSLAQVHVHLSGQPHVHLLPSHRPKDCDVTTSGLQEHVKLVDVETPHVILEPQAMHSRPPEVRQTYSENAKHLPCFTFCVKYFL